MTTTITFIRDYSGPLTGGRYYPYGDVVTLPDDEQAAGLVAEGAAEMVTPPPTLAQRPTKDDPFQVVAVPSPPVSAPVETSTGAAPAMTVEEALEEMAQIAAAKIPPIVSTTAADILAAVPKPARKRASKKAKP